MKFLFADALVDADDVLPNDATSTNIQVTVNTDIDMLEDGLKRSSENGFDTRLQSCP